MKQPVIQTDNPALILANVETPIPRPVLDGVIKTQADVLIEFMNLIEVSIKSTLSLCSMSPFCILFRLQERQTARTMSKTNLSVAYGEMPPNIKPLFRRLASDGMLPNVEDKLLTMKDNLIKISHHRSLIKGSSNDNTVSGFDTVDGVLDLGSLAKTSRRIAALDVAVEAKPGLLAHGREVAGSDEWKHMFSLGGEVSTSADKSKLEPLTASPASSAASSPSLGSRKLGKNKIKTDLMPNHMLCFYPL